KGDLLRFRGFGILQHLLEHIAMVEHAEIVRRWTLVKPYLDRRQRSVWAAVEAEAKGHGGCTLLSKITGICTQAISNRKRELAKTKNRPAGSLVSIKRRAGAGRKRAELKNPELLPALERMLSDEVAGDPMSQQKWVRSSIRNLSGRLKEQGYQAGHGTVARLLHRLGYSLQVTKKKQAGAQHPERDIQFQYIAALKAQYIGQGLPVISIDTKKKELIGNYRRDGKVWRRVPMQADAYFPSYRNFLAVPFGIYDLAQNAGYVTIGVSTNSSEFAVNCLEAWWRMHGKLIYPNQRQLLIFADGGGANGYNLRTWKKGVQEKICDNFGLSVTVSHYPPGCSKWNPIEYRLFSHIS